MAIFRTYRTYQFIDKDPAIDKLRTVLQDVGLEQKLTIVSKLSGVSYSALDNWFNGETRRPQNASLAAVVTSVGYEVQYRKVGGKLDIDAELEVAKEFALKQRKLRDAQKGRDKQARKRKKSAK